jgi:hypothetical protein
MSADLDERPNRFTIFVGKLFGIIAILAALSLMVYIGDVRENAAARARPPSKTKPINWRLRDRGQRNILLSTIGLHAATIVVWVLMTIQPRTFWMNRSAWHLLFMSCYVAGLGLGGLMWYLAPPN